MIKILFIIPSLAKGGAERLVLNICNELTIRENIQVKLITFHEKNDYLFLSKNIDHQVIPASYIPSLKGKSLIDVVDLQKAIDNFKPDVIHSHLFESEMILSAISYDQCKYFVHFHDNMKQFENLSVITFRSKEKITNYFERNKVLKKYAKRRVEFITISKDSYDFAKKNIPRKFPITLLYNVIDVSRFLYNDDQNRDNLRLVIIGSLVNKKGQDLAIDVVKEMHDRGLKVFLDILGDGPNYQFLKNQITNYKLDDYIILHGNVDYPETFLAKSKVYLHTASYEPFGLVLIEAMASGTPVICTDAKGNRDLIVDGENGFMIYERNATLIADRLEQIINNQELWNKLSTSARKFSKEFDISPYVDKLLKLYNKVK